jgi:predicted metalloprotease with PDZ domain
MNAARDKSISGKQTTAVAQFIMRRRLLFLKTPFLIILLAAAGAVTTGRAQSLSVTVDVLPGAPGRLLMQGSTAPRQTWSFRDSYAGVLGLGNRVRGFQLFDANGKQIAVRRIAPGQFESSAPAVNFKYEIELTPTARPSDAVFTSWLTLDRGMLMLGDVLPELPSARETTVSVRLVMPSGWTAYASDSGKSVTQIETTDPDRSVVVIGKKARISARTILGKPLTLLTAGDWSFADNDILDVAKGVLEFHSKNIGPAPCESASLVLLPLPQPSGANKWSAQTRGCTVTMLMNAAPSRVAAVAQLQLALTHELFHFWVPNGLALKGDYDWFYEGFTMYEAARAAVRLEVLSFDQFLNAIADAYDGSSGSDAQNLSLIEASKQRWTGGSSIVYSKAMVVALLYDLNLRSQTKGKQSLDDVYRTLMRDHLAKSSAAGLDANNEIVTTLRSEFADQDFVNRLVIARASINLEKELAPFGLRAEKPGVRTHISVNAQLTNRQRDLLKQLGYNEPRRR